MVARLYLIWVTLVECKHVKDRNSQLNIVFSCMTRLRVLWRISGGWYQKQHTSRARANARPSSKCSSAKVWLLFSNMTHATLLPLRSGRIPSLRARQCWEVHGHQSTRSAKSSTLVYPSPRDMGAVARYFWSISPSLQIEAMVIGDNTSGLATTLSQPLQTWWVVIRLHSHPKRAPS